MLCSDIDSRCPLISTVNLRQKKFSDDEYRSEISPAKKSRRIHQILRPFIGDI